MIGEKQGLGSQDGNMKSEILIEWLDNKLITEKIKKHLLFM